MVGIVTYFIVVKGKTICPFCNSTVSEELTRCPHDKHLLYPRRTDKVGQKRLREALEEAKEGMFPILQYD